MTKKKMILLILLFTLGLSACGNKKSEETSQEEVVNQIYTSVAETLAARATATLTPTLVLLDSATATPVPTMTLGSATQAPLPTVTSLPPTEIPCHEAIYMNDVTVPDGTVFAPGETFTKTWRIFNAGSCDWETTYALSFASGEEMSGAPVALGVVIPPNGQSDISVNMTAPLTAGSYTGYWRLTDAEGYQFGNSIYVEITVADHTATPTATTGATETSTPTEPPTTVPTSSTP